MKIKIAGKYFEHYNDVSVDTSLDAVASTFSFTAKYDHKNAFHREVFRPLSYHRIEFLHDNGRPISTGTITTSAFNSKAAPELVQVSGYSLGGVLEDCNIPYELYPLESNNRSLKEIAERLLKYFGIPLVVYQEVAKDCNQIIPKTVAEPQDTIKDYLSKIAAQKKVLLSHDVYGNVIMFRPKVNSASKGLYTKENAEEMSLSIDGQAMHSSITTLRQPSKPKKGSKDILSDDYDPLEGSDDDVLGSGTKAKKKILLPVDTVYNPIIKVKRPKVDKLSSGDVTDTLKGAENTIANELKAISVSFSISRWDPISIGDIIEVQNDEIYLEKPLRMMVYNTVINESSEVKNSTITCVLPGTFTGEMPKTIFT
jgi:prophage tail gpP-like protein